MCINVLNELKWMCQQKCVAVARHVCRSRVVYQGRFKCSLCSKIAWATSTGRKYVIAISNTKTEKVDIEIKMEMKLKLPVLTTGEKAIAMANDEKPSWIKIGWSSSFLRNHFMCLPAQ